MSEKTLSVNFKMLKKDFNDDYVITLPLILFNQLSNCLSSFLKLGGLQYKVIALPNFTSNTIELTPFLMEALGFCEDTKCFGGIQENTIALGPVIAVFSTNGSVRRAHEETASFRLLELAKANEIANTILYFFTIKDVDFINKKISGTFYNLKTNSWDRKNFPFPDVFYDRGGGVLVNQKPVSDYIRKQFNNDHCKKINPQHYFDKWDVHKNLMKYDKITHYLPQTVLYQNTKDLEMMFQQASILYIKDCYGSNGRGVMRVTKLPDYGFEYSYTTEDTVTIKRVKTFDELSKVVDLFFNRKKTLIQNAINLIKINNSNVDMRATVQRDGKGNLAISPYPVRVGKSKSPITSTKSGSSVITFEDFFETFFNYTDEEICHLMEDINHFLTEIYLSIEDIYGRFGEIGIDFAIDMDGLIWFIECNAKPGKDTLYYSYGGDIVKKAFLNPLEYGKYITGFNP